MLGLGGCFCCAPAARRMLALRCCASALPAACGAAACCTSPAWADALSCRRPVTAWAVATLGRSPTAWAVSLSPRRMPAFALMPAAACLVLGLGGCFC
eukprot:13028552-Alexandrium_andersonii.AAC.1